MFEHVNDVQRKDIPYRKYSGKKLQEELKNMAKMTKKGVLKLVKEKKIRYVELWFVDILGRLKGFTITDAELEDALESGKGFDGSSVEGFARIYESDLLALPEPETFAILPRHQEGDIIGRMFCGILNPDGTPYVGDTRHVLKTILAEARKSGYIYYVGPELEYFYFRTPENTQVLDEGGYFDTIPVDFGFNLRRQTCFFLEKVGVPVEYTHHEVAPSQHEIDLRYTDALAMADAVITYKVVAKKVAADHGVFASFMPKPVFGVNGSGMHVHQSLFKNNRNAFFDAKDKYLLSDTAKYFTAGLLEHIPGITAVLNQWVNSYKRLVPGYEAPVYLSWARRNRSALVRVPEYKPGRENATRIELRSPDPACNPYLAFALMLGAGLDGIRRKVRLSAPVEKDIFAMSHEQRQEEKISTLPGSLVEALSLFSRSHLARRILGDHIFTKFIENKEIEWDKYRTFVTDYETKEYLPLL